MALAQLDWIGGGGIDIDFSAYDVFSNNDNLASHANFDVTVTQKPKYIIVLSADSYPRTAVYLFDVKNNKLTQMGKGASNWSCSDYSSSIATYFPTVSDSKVTFYNAASVAKFVGVWCYY